MFYLARFRSDGAVASLEAVADSYVAGERQLVVEAASKEEALRKARKEWKSWKEALRSEAARRNKCADCYHADRESGYVRCSDCKAKRAAKKRRRAEVLKMPEAERELANEQIRIAGEQARRVAMITSSKIGTAILTTAADVRLDKRGLRPQAYTPGSLLRWVSRAYDRDPSGFRVWLDDQLDRTAKMFAAKRAKPKPIFKKRRNNKVSRNVPQAAE
jgi:hypothetical protein